jgi:hypothetical protein
VSRFYDADALLETTASRRLLPLAHRETIADGRRRIDRQVTYDSARRQVHVTSGGTSITLPLGLDARDPMSALFYLRTLPMSGGSRFTLPLSDNGRPWTLDVAVDRLESILVEGQPWSAWKIEPRLANRFERHRLTISAWVSADPRHVPLRVEVVAPFGSVRLDLASYRER